LIARHLIHLLGQPIAKSLVLSRSNGEILVTTFADRSHQGVLLAT
jgi:hypothetical protein